jgi:hypothetical protein
MSEPRLDDDVALGLDEELECDEPDTIEEAHFEK